MATHSKLAVILHADVVGSTALVRKDERLAHDRIQAAFQRFSEALRRYGGTVHEVRGDALVAEFSRASDAALAAVSAQSGNTDHNAEIADEIVPRIRVGIALGEVVIADDTLTGAGVVLAQRLEQLADPNSVCISAAVREAVPDRLPLEYASLGPQDAKGFDVPVVAYIASRKLDKPLPEPDVELARTGNMAFTLPDKPSIAVLPFDNFSSNEQDKALADGFSENLTAVLARMPGFMVTARNSAFSFRGGNVPVREVAERLSVRYIVEGSMQRSGEMLRVTAQLVDALSGQHRWAETYDRALEDFFALQDEIALRIARELSAQLVNGEMARGDDATNLKAFLKLREGWSNFGEFSQKANLRARTVAEEVICLDSSYARAQVLRAWTYAVDARFRYADDIAQTWANAEQYAQELIERFPMSAGGYEVLAYIRQFNQRNYAESEQLYERALQLEPSRSGNLAMLASVTFLRGKWQRTIELRREAMRLEPLYPTWYLLVLGYAHVFNGESDEAIELAESALMRDELPPNRLATLHSVAALAHAAAGRAVAAKRHVDEMLKLTPDATVEAFSHLYPFEDVSHTEEFRAHFVAAGLPYSTR